MKKVLAICLVMLMAVSMSVSAFAASGGFVSSPSGNPAPRLISFDPHNDECAGGLVVTSYADRDELSDELKALIESAYGDILAYDDLTTLCPALAALAGNKGIDSTNLAVSDLFNISITDCEAHESHTGFDIVLEADTLKNFVGLMYMTEDGKWELVENAEVVNGNHLQFTVDSAANLAIVVDTGNDAPPTGDDSNIHIYVIVMAVSALAIAIIWRKYKKQTV